MLPLPVGPALDLLSQPITAYDLGDTTAGEWVDGRWVEGNTGDDYVFSGSLQPAGERELKLLPEGDASDGAIMITTKQKLFIADTNQATGIQDKQTYIRHSGEIWRVRAQADWVIPGGFDKWVCTKYLEQ